MRKAPVTIASIGLSALSFLCFQLVALSPAWANTITASSPAQNAVITTTPNVVSITTDEPLVQEGTSIQVIDPTGNEVDDHSLTVSGSTAVIGMQNLSSSGVYKVLYNLYFDTSTPLIGNYSFTFNSPGSISNGGTNNSSNGSGNSSSSGTTGSSSNSGSNSNSSQSNTQPTSSNNGGNTFIYILMLSALIVGLALLWYAYVLLERNRGKRAKAAARKSAAQR
jgi:methionine-rich copper-binding protein CopC